MKQFFVKFFLKHIVWDFDGTLYQNEKLGRDIKNFYFKKCQETKPLTLPEFELLTQKHGSWAVAASNFTHLQELKLLNLCDAKVDKKTYMCSNPYIVEIIEKKLSKYNHLILTNSLETEVRDCLKIIGFKPTTFDKIFARDNTHLLKPNSHLFSLITQYTHSPKWRHLFVGDSLSSDIIPAQKHGFPTIPIWEFLNTLS